MFRRLFPCVRFSPCTNWCVFQAPCKWFRKRLLFFRFKFKFVELIFDSSKSKYFVFFLNFCLNSFQKTTTLNIPPPSNPTKPDNLAVNKICISEPDDSNPRTPLTPETIDRTPVDEKVNKNQLTPTITEETEQDDQSVSCKSSLSLPVEPQVGPVEKDRRKLSVQGLMAFAERRRSSSTFADMRKMSVSNGDGIHIRSPGGNGNPLLVPFQIKTFNLICLPS